MGSIHWGHRGIRNTRRTGFKISSYMFIHVHTCSYMFIPFHHQIIVCHILVIVHLTHLHLICIDHIWSSLSHPKLNADQPPWVFLMLPMVIMSASSISKPTETFRPTSKVSPILTWTSVTNVSTIQNQLTHKDWHFRWWSGSLPMGRLKIGQCLLVLVQFQGYMSGGQNDSLLAMDMAKVGGPLLVVKAFAHWTSQVHAMDAL